MMKYRTLRNRGEQKMTLPVRLSAGRPENLVRKEEERARKMGVDSGWGM